MSRLIKSKSINALKFKDELVNIAQSNNDLISKIEETIDLCSSQFVEDGVTLDLEPTELQAQAIAFILDFGGYC